MGVARTRADQRWKHQVAPIPLVCIGGLNLTVSKAFFEAGAESAAVVTDFALNDAPEARTREWIERPEQWRRGENHMCSLLSGQTPAVGAGIAREIQTIASSGVRTCLAVSALTVQTHEHAWKSKLRNPVRWRIGCALRFSLTEWPPPRSACSQRLRSIVAAVAAVLREYPRTDNPDPVLASTSGRAFLKQAPSRIMK
ncbi:hypothetical protein X760_32735 [Mesorhizobium sp. LSHC422A00]|nr:hypothetical protein X762_30050 [Mesorhizobium sp. LSHC426A00]ESX47316.1 hypothetical protein X761_30475 [Mesorhizobium sp. LSHC424B00]ESX48558.1 hypothetical protein X760_32735 [Mesorhizobium sp. LSHC422A00]ESX65032.1 hypothetical protein X758_30475 [Mesorhizobium sp. LSHC416B00]